MAHAISPPPAAPATNTPERELVARLAARDADAWREIFGLLYDQVFADAFMLTGDRHRSAAIAAHAFVELAQQAERASSMRRIVESLARITLREATRHCNGHQPAVIDEDQQYLARAWRGLGADRWILLERIFAGEPASSVAAALDVSEDAVRKRQMRALQSLARRLPEARL
jgi:DNA-directed RNA polymerase specialized sigma24 family protein